MKFGTVAIIGRSNVCKSTLLNRLLDEKIAIVSEKPQTTRTRILGVVHAPGAQIALLDTPGLHKPQHLLNRRMVRTAVETLEEADVLFVLMDATSLPGPGDLLVVDHVTAAVNKRRRPVLLVLNKIDLVNKIKLLPVLEHKTFDGDQAVFKVFIVESKVMTKTFQEIQLSLLHAFVGPQSEHSHFQEEFLKYP